MMKRKGKTDREREREREKERERVSERETDREKEGELWRLRVLKKEHIDNFLKVPCSKFSKSEFCMFDRLRGIFGPQEVPRKKIEKICF